MWPGQQPPGGEQNPQDPNQSPYQQPGYQQPNPYQQPGSYQQQPGPYGQPGQQPGGGPQWNVPTAPMSSPKPPGDDRKKTTVIAVVAATAVVIAAGVTGFLVLGGDTEDEAKGGEKPSASSSSAASSSPAAEPSDNPRGNGPDIKPVIPGWQVVINPKRGTAFDVPKNWEVKDPGVLTAYEDIKTEKPLISMTGIAEYKPDWCEYDDNNDGRKDSYKLAGAGTKGANGVKNSDEAAEFAVGWWIYGPFTQPNKKNIKITKPVAYESKSGLKGSVSWAESTGGVDIRKGSCDSEGKAVSFGFKNSVSDYVVWSLYGPKDVDGEVDTATIKKILSSVRLSGDPQEG